ncbi:MAG: hypothetical protein Q7S23_06185 [bacterium]|nr:hypothetical protein [bacterium]
MKTNRIRARLSGLMLALALVASAPISAFAQVGGTIPNLEPVCDSLMVVDFITDAEGNTLKPGDAVADQYRMWGVNIAAWNDGGSRSATVAELPSSTGPVSAARVGNGQAGTISFEFASIVSVQAVELIGANRDGGKILVYDQNSELPAGIPVTAGRANEIRALTLDTLDAATRMDVALTEGSGVSAIYLCPLSSPKQVPKHNFPALAINAVLDEDVLRSGQSTDVTVTITNTGYSVGYDLTLAQQLPPGLVFADDNSRERVWDLGAIGSRGSYTLAYPVKAETVASTVTVATYVTSMISNGRGSEGAAYDRLEFTLQNGAVLGAGSPEPVQPAKPVAQAPKPTPTPTVAGTATPAPTPKPAFSPVATPTPEEPIGGPQDSPTPEGTPETAASPAPTSDTLFGDDTNEKPLVLPAGGLATDTATTTPGLLSSCTNWLGLLGALNAVLIAMLAMKERKVSKDGGSRWVVVMLAAAVPMIIWYPACELNYWLAVTAVAAGAMLYFMANKGGPSGEITAPPEVNTGTPPKIST